MKTTFYTLFMLLLITNLSVSQNSKLYVPLNIQQVIKNGTRSYTGTPGKEYWQNSSDYKIKAEILTDSSYLIGNEIITYYNNSPDTLKKIVFRIYQDISKKGALRDWYLPATLLNDGVKINYIIVKNDTLDLTEHSKDISRGSTNLVLKLKNKLNPQSKIKIKVGWEFKIPTNIKIRMGNYGNGNMFVAYWYPQVSVYDDIDGWDMLDYEGSVEFYNDFSNYDVELKLPKGFLAWATGELQNAKDVLRNDIFKKYELAKKTDKTIKIITQDDYKKGIVTKENDFNIWKFNANNVTDFSFAISNNYNWDGTSTIVGKEKTHRVLTDVVYPDSAFYWNKGAQISKIAIDYFSNELPGYPYPYSHITSFCNSNKGGGMETPMMTNDGEPKSVASLVGLLSHEIAHSYFPFIMGTNERKYAWMDEGWASFFPREIVDRYVPTHDYWLGRSKAYSRNAGKESELPPIVPSYTYKGRYARTGFYNRPTNAYRELEILLGRDLFKKALLEYMKRWNGKHPIPYDFFFTFNEIANEDLTWFWKPWFFEFGYPDLTIEDVEQNNDKILIKVRKLGNIPTRVEVTIEFEDRTKKIIKKSVKIWQDEKDFFEIKLLGKNKKIKSVTVGNKHIPDAVKKNNTFIIK
jgi:hypothetical protein